MKIGTLVRTATALTAVVGGIAVGARGTGMASGLGASARAPHKCWNFQLTMRPLKSSSGAGHVGRMYRLHNILPGACTLHGYPGAMLLDANFNSLPTTVTTGLGYLAGKHAPVTVTLQGNHDAYFVLEWVHIPSPGQTCPKAKYVMSIPPNDYLPVVTYAGNGGIVACGGNLTASPVVPNPFNF